MTLRDRARRFMPASGSLGAILLAVLIPKCPMCIAAALSALGLGATLSGALAPIARPAGFVLAALAVTFAIAIAVRRRRACCRKGGSPFHGALRN